MNSIKKININPNDFSKISKELISYITLKDGTILISDDTVESKDIKDIDKLIKNKPVKINYNINTCYEKTYKTLENNNIYRKIEENKNNYKSNEQSISNIINEKFQKKFGNNSKEISKISIRPTINSEININIKGTEPRNCFNNLINDFNELLTNFNYKKKGIQNNANYKEKNKYKYYKRNTLSKKDKLYLENLSGLSTNSKTIKYIGRNENNITDINDKNLFGINYTKKNIKVKKILKRNKSNHLYFLKDNRFLNIISPPNYLHYKNIKFL